MFRIRKLLYRLAAMASVVILASGCGSSVDPFGPAVDVSLIVLTPSGASSTLHASFGNRSVSLSMPEGSTNRVDKRVRGMGYGEMPVRFTLLGTSGDTLASVRFTQNLQPNYNYGIGAIVGSERLPSFCSATVAAVPLRNSTNDSLFVEATGIPDGAVC